MKKRFTDCEKWTKNKWFRKLSNENKLFWLFILDNCDNVGVWEEDVELVSLLLGYKYEKEKLISQLGDRIKLIQNNEKWWIIDFCNFQYGTLTEDNLRNRPFQSYIKLLKNHRLWIDYQYYIDTLKDKEKDKDKDKDTVKDKEEEENKDKDINTIKPYYLKLNSNSLEIKEIKTNDTIKKVYKKNYKELEGIDFSLCELNGISIPLLIGKAQHGLRWNNE